MLKVLLLAMIFIPVHLGVVCSAEPLPGTRLSSTTQTAEAPRFPRADADLASSDADISKLRAEFARLPSNAHKKDWVKAKLAHMLKLDQSLRHRFYVPFNGKYSPEENRYYMKKFDTQLQTLDKENTADLKKLLEIYVWFRISEWGKGSDEAAWLIAQHSDEDVPFQREILKRLKTLYLGHETDPRNYAMLSDRVAVHENRPQPFGTQGGCAGPGLWKPDPIEDPAQLDKLRRSVGLGPEEAEITSNGGGCK